MNFLKSIFNFDPEIDYQYGLKEDMFGNKKKAYYFFQKAANKNHAKAQFECGYYCLFGRGIQKNLADAFMFISKSAKQDFFKAQYLLSQMYLFGIGVVRDKTQSDYWLEQSERSGMDLSKLSFLDLWEGFE